MENQSRFVPVGIAIPLVALALIFAPACFWGKPLSQSSKTFGEDGTYFHWIRFFARAALVVEYGVYFKAASPIAPSSAGHIRRIFRYRFRYARFHHPF